LGRVANVSDKKRKGIQVKKAILFLVAMIGLFLPHLSPAQGTVYVSNLGNAPIANTTVGSDSWRAASFRTGTNSTGYILNSIQLLMASASESPSGIGVMLYSANGGVPGNNLGNLLGPDPVIAGVYTYTASSLTLSADTSYYVVLSSATAVADGSFRWCIADLSSTFSVSGGWRATGGFFSSTDSSTWTPYRPNPFQFAVEATAVPEPSVSATMALGLASLSLLRCRK
jgi:hypothetical protein